MLFELWGRSAEEGESKSKWLTTYQKMMKRSSWKQQESATEDWIDRMEVVWTSGMYYTACLSVTQS